jgi:hypothetical protein
MSKNLKLASHDTPARTTPSQEIIVIFIVIVVIPHQHLNVTLLLIIFRIKIRLIVQIQIRNSRGERLTRRAKEARFSL